MATDQANGLAADLDGELIDPADDRYDEARRLFNGRFDRRPAVIARCRRVDDVIAAVALAGERGLRVSVRASGHGLGGQALSDGALAIDVGAMRRVEIDAQRRRATVEPGVTWGELDAAAQARGLAVTGARTPSIGVVGFATGGGSGWLERRLGLACDNIVSAEVVTGEGRLLTAAAGEHDDLLWALRGGGAGSGVVTQLELALHPVGPTVLAGRMLHPVQRAPDVLAFLRELAAAAPEQLGIGSALVALPDAPPLPPPLRGRRVIGVTVCWCGEPAEGERVLAPRRALGAPLLERIAPIPYLEAQRLLSSPPGDRYHAESGYFEELDDARIEALMVYAGEARSPGDEVVVLPWSGAVTRGDDGPLSRPPGWLVHVLSHWRSPDDDARQVAWARAARDAVAGPDAAGFPNLSSRPRPARDFAASERLEQVRRRYDPEGMLRPLT